MHEKLDMQAVIDTAQQAVSPTSIEVGLEGLAYLPHPAGRVEDLSKYADVPRRLSGCSTVYDADSLVRLVKATEGAAIGVTRVYVDKAVRSLQILAVLNDTGETPAWRDALVELKLRKTPAFEKWCGIDGKMLAQVDFAEFIEDNLLDIASPSGAEMLEIAQGLHATRRGEFKSAQRLSNGSIEFTCSENLEAKVPGLKIPVPEKFEIALAPFEGCAPFRIPVRFRYRFSEGGLTLGIKLERIESLIETVIADVLAVFAEADLTVIMGRPA